ncbi:hypothetical protein TGAM01_v203943 [Trichoderma gamsii]|uniref:Uncharacterized protein n=1 Tax=Trichoderma gamsii TaxID=398673 RepID=A0A2P4ZRV2_9HYPO|nr:hypothetical protein TGAM01_v203943 [Trichoderma gamsii]
MSVPSNAGDSMRCDSMQPGIGAFPSR